MSTTLSGEVRPCILIASEDALFGELLQQTLHLAGFTALLASTGERALLHLRESRHSVEWLVASRSLPGLVDGFILADEFQALHPSRAPLFLTDASAASASEIVAQLRALTQVAVVALDLEQAEANPALAA